jgi:tetratricopeptide (TPR) repeat protein
MHRLFTTVALLATVSTSLVAQRLGPAAPRPHLRDVVDTNDAHAYYNLGLASFKNDPEEAAAAFYWAARINPGWGEPLYARRAALIMMDPRMLKGLMEDNRRVMESKEMRRLDSLQARALMLSPFLYRQLDRQMFMAYFKKSIMEGSNGDAPPNLDYEIERYLTRSSESMRAYLSYGDGDFPNALLHYANALSGSKDKSTLHLSRARIFGMQGRVPDAVEEFRMALDEMRKKDQKDLVVFYNSKALAEYSIAVLQEGAGDNTGAREAYGRALLEDLAYYPAHMRLGLLALGTRDTATAVNELSLAAQIAPEEPHIRYLHAYGLIGAARYVEAAAELRKTIELEPYYALPYLWLGRVFEQLEKGKDALTAYQQFIDHASAGDPQLAFATGKRDELKEFLAAVPQKP